MRLDNRVGSHSFLLEKKRIKRKTFAAKLCFALSPPGFWTGPEAPKPIQSGPSAARVRRGQVRTRKTERQSGCFAAKSSFLILFSPEKKE
ncbi:MAG: hypothetical protein K2P26_02490 [Oscillospiraceae bacterium]|nr:hypothetical protein [Oscillospiraceae bacterium]